MFKVPCFGFECMNYIYPLSCHLCVSFFFFLYSILSFIYPSLFCFSFWLLHMLLHFYYLPESSPWLQSWTSLLWYILFCWYSVKHQQSTSLSPSLPHPLQMKRCYWCFLKSQQLKVKHVTKLAFWTLIQKEVKLSRAQAKIWTLDIRFLLVLRQRTGIQRDGGRNLFFVLVLFGCFFFWVGVFLQRVVWSYPCNGTTLNIQLPPAFQLAEHVCPRDLEKGGTSRERLATVFYHF